MPKYYPNQQAVNESMQVNDPLLMLVSHNGQEILLANIDDSFEHIILLKQLGYPESDIDKYYRVVVNQQGADWIFMCPSNIEVDSFYNAGMKAIKEAINEIGYDCSVEIPERYIRNKKVKL